MAFHAWTPSSVLEYYEEKRAEQQASYLEAVAFYSDLDERGELPRDATPEALAEQEKHQLNKPFVFSN